jgi:hypothetical protein
MEKLSFKSIQFRDRTSGDRFPITVGKRSTFIGLLARNARKGNAVALEARRQAIEAAKGLAET